MRRGARCHHTRSEIHAQTSCVVGRLMVCQTALVGWGVICSCVSLLYLSPLQIDDNRRVTSFAEKPKGAALQEMKVCVCVCVV